MVKIHNTLSNLRVELDSYYLQMRKKLFSYIHIFLNKILGDQIYLPNHSLDSHQIGKISHESDAPSLSLAKKITYYFKKVHGDFLNKVNASNRLKDLHQMMCNTDPVVVKHNGCSAEIPKSCYDEMINTSVAQLNKSKEDALQAISENIVLVTLRAQKIFGKDNTDRMLTFFNLSCMKSFILRYPDGIRLIALPEEKGDGRAEMDQNSVRMRYRILVKLMRKENENDLKLEGYFVMKTIVRIPRKEIGMDVENFKNLTTENWKIIDEVSFITTNKNEAEHLFKQF